MTDLQQRELAAQLRAEAAAEYRHAASWNASAQYADSYQAREQDELRARDHETRAQELLARAATLETPPPAMDAAWPEALEARPPTAHTGSPSEGEDSACDPAATDSEETRP